MDKKDVLAALQKVRESSPKRQFKQSIDLIINIKGIDLKKNENQIDIFPLLHFGRGKDIKICAFVGPELKSDAQATMTTAIPFEDFQNYQKDPKSIKKLARDHDFFVAQSNIMPQVAVAFGKVLGPRGKMPNPKAGCVVPPNGNLKALVLKLQKTVRVLFKERSLFQCKVGTEDLKDEEIVDNIMVIYGALAHVLPNEQHNFRNAFVKLTMGPSVRIGGKAQQDLSTAGKKGSAKNKSAPAAAESKPQESAPKPKGRSAPKEGSSE